MKSKLLALFLMGFALPVFADGVAATLYKNPGCGCCEAYAAYLRANGIDVKVVETGELVAMQRQSGVPAEMASCHLVKAEGYFFDGHMPVDSIKRFLKEKPDAKGLSAPGMPPGSPGMGGVKTQPIKVYALSDKAPPKLYAQY